MTSTDRRVAGVLLLTSPALMLVSVAIVVPAGLTLNPADPTAALTAVRAQVGLHLAELAFDVLGWIGLTAAGMTLAAGVPRAALPGGLLAAAGLAGVLHDAGNLAVTQLAAETDPAAVAAARALLLAAKWEVNLAGLLWAAALAAAAVRLALPRSMRLCGAVAAGCGLAAVALPWTTGTAGPSPAVEQLGYVLQLPVLVWFAVLGWRQLRRVDALPGAGAMAAR
ncbi:hypothetical protein [Pseudonocardia humida]|uniref:DUF4386 family protein n=1 Tax=Pseudonocardia humida TaxID=2800819 RepID=A0ABT1AA96_9PSEU|nr:hypothetical protein [Pseudonocardia humida]MCO1659955.1 hypothetical protein [Pseudonocardia humida]